MIKSINLPLQTLSPRFLCVIYRSINQIKCIELHQMGIWQKIERKIKAYILRKNLIPNHFEILLEKTFVRNHHAG